MPTEYYTCAFCITCEDCVSCDACLRCQGCNKCQNIDECQPGCDKCQKCDATCQVTCEQAQVLKPQEQGCSSLGQFLQRNFTFSVCPETTTPIGPEDTIDGVPVFNLKVWNEIIEYYNEGVGLGKLVSFFEKDIDYATKEDVAPFKAAEFNRVAQALKLKNVTVQPGDLILGSYFKQLETAASQVIGQTKACDKCNIECNCDGKVITACNVCQTCNSGCQVTCNACQGCDACEGCEKCNGCVSTQSDAMCRQVPVCCHTATTGIEEY